MRVVHVATSYPRDPDDPSGHFVRADALADARAGHEVHVVAPLPFAGDADIRAHAFGGGELFAWPGAVARGRARPARWLAAPGALIRGARRIAAIDADVIVSHWALPSAWPMSAPSRRARLRIVSHGGDVRLLIGLPARARASIVGRLLDRCEAWRFVAASLERALSLALPRSLSDALATVSVVRPPRVEVSDAGDAGARDHLVTVGRLVREKRVDLAIDAARAARVPLVVVGDGPEDAALRRRAASADVRFTGRLGRRDALGWMRGARALLHPSELDAAPTCVLEARALGVPVVAADVGDLARWAQTDDGLSIVRRDAAAWTAAILRAGDRLE